MGLTYRDDVLRNLSRKTMADWINEWFERPETQNDLKDFIEDKLEGVQEGLSTETVNTSARDDYESDETPLITIIMDDMESYGKGQIVRQ